MSNDATSFATSLRMLVCRSKKVSSGILCRSWAWRDEGTGKFNIWPALGYVSGLSRTVLTTEKMAVLAPAQRRGPNSNDGKFGALPKHSKGVL